MRNILLGIFSTIASFSIYAQDDLLDILEEESANESFAVEATFKGTRVINGHSVETRMKNNLDLLISHRFGKISGGSYQFFGLDQSNVRIGFDYGLTNDFNIGIGRNSFEKTFDGYFKYRILKQTKGGKEIPVSITLFSSTAIKTLKDETFDDDVNFTTRLVYTHQLLVARKLSPSFSLQLMPSYVHFNAITAVQTVNDLYSIGVGGRIKLTNRLSLNAEYFYQIETLAEEVSNSIAIGFDIETGGHVFQLHFTNSQSMIEKGFISETFSDFFGGDIHFGFNISRTFQVGAGNH